MLNDATKNSFKKVYIACGRTDLRYGVTGLATLVKCRYHLDPYDKGTLFLFCGRRSDRLKALLWEGDGFLLMSKYLCDGHFQWPRDPAELKSLTYEQYRLLMEGFAIDRSIKEGQPKYLV
ncbi:MAG: IS66 family insertion sequence element accessory protein TnpB [Lachnospiraceae bacterium]|nr:IS66 family insertion sequence element accessory protein TnpB [Lachnospiraceae bacterium]